MMHAGLTKEHLMSLADNLAATITDPKFLRRIQDVQEAGNYEAQYAVAKATTAESLVADGVELPEGLRVAPRTFENPDHAEANGVQVPGCEPGSDKGDPDPASFDRSSWAEAPLEGEPAEIATPQEIAYHLKASLKKIAEFVSDDPFLGLLAEMAVFVEPDDRPRFVLDVVLNEQERQTRGVEVPEGMLIQRSTFHDGRATLFCVSALTPLGYPWRKVTFTFDNRVLDCPPNS